MSKSAVLDIIEESYRRYDSQRTRKSDPASIMQTILRERGYSHRVRRVFEDGEYAYLESIAAIVSQ